MARCKHDHEVVIDEQMVTSITHCVLDGAKMGEASLDGEGEPTGFIVVTCRACGKSVRLNRYVSRTGFDRVPMWVHLAADAAGIPIKFVGESMRRKLRRGRGRA